jgi:hypothetical protein
MAGEVASLLLSRMTVPVLFYLSERKKHEQPSVTPRNPPPDSFDEAEFSPGELLAIPAESVPSVEPTDCTEGGHDLVG